jgi:hypothetical protein
MLVERDIFLKVLPEVVKKIPVEEGCVLDFKISLILD